MTALDNFLAVAPPIDAPRTGRVDVYCLFCRVLLVHPAVWQWDYTERLRPHTTMCALRFLAGELEPGAPGTYRLPEVAP